MKIAISLAILVAAFLPQEASVAVRALRTGLGGERAIASIATLHITAKIKNAQLGSGDADIFCELPDRFVEKIEAVIKGGGSRPAVPNSRAQPYDPVSAVDRLTEAPLDLSPRDAPQYSYVGIAGGEPLLRGVKLPLYAQAESRQQLIDAARRAFARLAIPLLGGNQDVGFTEQRGAELIFIDRQRTEWKLVLDASGLPSTLTWHVPPGTASLVRGSLPAWVSTFSDYRPAGNLIWPHRITTTLDGQPYEELTIKRYEINGKIPANTFRR